MAVKLAVAAVVVLALAGQAYAHPFMLETDPERLSSAHEGTSKITVQYSEEIELGFSELKVFDGAGNQIDNGDTAYYGGERALSVTVPPLQEGVYTVSSKVLSKVDGHLVPDAFVFGVGGAVAQEDVSAAESTFYPEAVAAFPGLVGQTAALGALATSLLVWGWRGRGPASKAGDAGGGLMAVAGAGAVAVLASNILVLAVHAWRLESTPLDSLGTTFGQTWIIRMAGTIALLGAWFAAKRSRMQTPLSRLPMLAAALAVAATSTMTGHGTATGLPAAAILDYLHNVVAALWIGGVIYLCFGVLPSIASDPRRGDFVLTLVPRFSAVATASIGAVVITGPLLMWMLEDDPASIASSTYGTLLATKIALAVAMAGIGAYHQFGVARGAPGRAYARMRRALKAESVLGIALLGAVALLTNSALPAGEADQATALQRGFAAPVFAGDVRFDVEVFPFAPGTNSFSVSPSVDGESVPDITNVQVKISNPARNIPPIRAELERNGDAYHGEAVFGFTGTWLVEIEARRSGSPSAYAPLELLVKPRLDGTRADVTEYGMPEGSKPLYPLYHDGELWISDSAMPVVWRFDGELERFDIGGQASQMLAAGPDGRVWYTDGAGAGIGYVDPATGGTEHIDLPDVFPLHLKSVPGGIAAGPDGVWITVVAKGALLRYDPGSDAFREYRLPDQQSGPFAVMERGGQIWFTESGTGKLGMLEPSTGDVWYASTGPLSSPEALLDDGEGNIWITEHTGSALVKYNVLLDSARRVPVDNTDALPFGMAADARGNIWFAEHVVDYIGVHDPHGGGTDEIPVPTSSSFVQFLAADDEGNIWFAEQNGGKIGYVAVSDRPPAPAQKEPERYRYSEVAAPLMAAGLAGAAIFFAKSVSEARGAKPQQDGRRGG